MRVLDSCQKALLEYTDIGYNYNVIKKGKGGKIIAVEFIIYKNEHYKDKLQLEKFIEKQPQLQEDDDYSINQLEPKYTEYLTEIKNLLGEVFSLDIYYLNVIYNTIRSANFPAETSFFEEDYSNSNLSESSFYYFLLDVVDIFLKNTGKKEINKANFNLFYSYIQDKLNSLNNDYSAYLPKLSQKREKPADDVLDGQISLDEVIGEQEKDYEAIYGSEELEILAEGVEYSFTRAEMEEISAILTRIKTPKQEDMNPYDAVIYGKQRYIREKYAKLKTEIEKKERKGEHIGCVFSYFKKMLENDTYKPLAYKKEDEE